MKILADEERNAHWNTVLWEGAKGTVIGIGASAALVYGVKRRYPAQFATFSPSIKAAMWAMPTISLAAFWADEGSVKFDEQKYRGEFIETVEKEKMDLFAKLSFADKVFTKVNENKYKIIISAWAASLWGSWHIVNKDKYMTVAQKAVQARVYAQAITVVLLLSTIVLSMHEQELKKSQPAPVPEWKKYLQEQDEIKHRQEEAHKNEPVVAAQKQERKEASQ